MGSYYGVGPALSLDIRHGTRLTLIDYIYPRITDTVPPPAGDGSVHALGDYYATLSAAQIDYPFLTSTFHGLTWSNCSLAAIALQAAINDGQAVSANGKVAEIYVPRGQYNLNIYIDAANRYLGGLRIIGAGCQSVVNNAYTAFVGNSGGVLFDFSGSEFVQLRDFAILPGTSTIGILQARTTDVPFQSQAHSYRDLVVAMSASPAANGGRGTIAIANFASELSAHSRLFLQADNPYFCSTHNPTEWYARRGDPTGQWFTFASPNANVHVATGTTLIPTYGSLGNLSFEGQCWFISSYNPPFTLNGCEHAHVKNGYFRNNTGVVYRVATTIAANIATGARTVTPASMSPGGIAIAVNTILRVMNADGSHAETVPVTAVTATTFTATFASSKTGPGIIVQVGDADLAAINIAGGVTNVSITGSAEEFDKILLTRAISFNLTLDVSRGHATATIPSIDFDNAGATVSPGLNGCSLHVFQGDLTTRTNTIAGDAAILIGKIVLGYSQDVTLTSGAGDLEIETPEWAPAVILP